jgi:hypothetical protein
MVDDQFFPSTLPASLPQTVHQVFVVFWAEPGLSLPHEEIKARL